MVVLVFLVGEGGELGNRVRLPRLEVVVAGGAAARRVLPVEEVPPVPPVLVLAVLPHRLGEVADAAVHLRIQPRAHRRRRWIRHPDKVEVPVVGEGDVRVVNALVRLPECLALLEAHVATISLPRWGPIDGRLIRLQRIHNF
jgi:hypothetical protein